MMQPAVDAHVAASTVAGARARIQGLYSAAGLVGGFVGASGCIFLYGLNFRLPLYTTGLTQVELASRLGVSQAQVARMEKRGYDAYTLNSLRRYIQALGEGFSLDIAVRWNRPQKAPSQIAANH
jgi:Helix-turn-helix